TRFSRDWSSDVCSSDLKSGLPERSKGNRFGGVERPVAAQFGKPANVYDPILFTVDVLEAKLGQPALQRHLAAFEPGRNLSTRTRSEERRVGEEGSELWD